MHWFFAENGEHGEIVLPEEESHHATKVLRLQFGTELVVFNGKGKAWIAEITQIHHKTTKIQTLRPLPEQNQENISIAIAPVKNADRLEWFVEKATELGVRDIFFILCANSERKKIRLDRLEKIALAACKQSQRLWLPRLHDMEKIDSFLKRISGNNPRLMAWCGDEQRPAEQMELHLKKADSPLILIGPEGDFRKEEVDLAVEQGVIPVSMGEIRLRTETAGIYALAAYKALVD